jgi:hypothetical protein
MRVRQRVPADNIGSAVIVSRAVLQVARQAARPGFVVEPTGKISRIFPVLNSYVGATLQLSVGVTNE